MFAPEGVPRRTGPSRTDESTPSGAATLGPAWLARTSRFHLPSSLFHSSGSKGPESHRFWPGVLDCDRIFRGADVVFTRQPRTIRDRPGRSLQAGSGGPGSSGTRQARQRGPHACVEPHSFSRVSCLCRRWLVHVRRRRPSRVRCRSGRLFGQHVSGLGDRLHLPHRRAMGEGPDLPLGQISHDQGARPVLHDPVRGRHAYRGHPHHDARHPATAGDHVGQRPGFDRRRHLPQRSRTPPMPSSACRSTVMRSGNTLRRRCAT